MSNCETIFNKQGEVKENSRIKYNMPASTAKVAHVRIEMFLRRSTPVGFRFAL